MMELPLNYMNSIANQVIMIASLLSGFSIAIVANLITEKTENRITNYIFLTTTVAASCFLVSVFAMTKIVMMTTEGYPVKVLYLNLQTPSLIGIIAFLLGITALSIVLGLSGWTKSRKMGISTTIIGVITFLTILVTMIDIQ